MNLALRHISLEIELHRKLNLTAGAQADAFLDGAADLSECPDSRRRRGERQARLNQSCRSSQRIRERRSRVRKVGEIHEVENLGSELEILPFTKFEPAVEHEVRLAFNRSMQAIAREIPESPRLRSGES